MHSSRAASYSLLLKRVASPGLVSQTSTHIARNLCNFFSLLAAAQKGFVANEQAKIFAFIAAVSIALLTAFNLGGKSNNTRTAWRQLNAAVMKFNERLIEKKELIEAYVEAENQIGDVTFQNK